MDMSMSGMDMGTATSTAAMASSTAMSGMGGMDMGGGSQSACKISMLWNWNTVDSCFISSSWHVTSKGMFAGSCIGVILLVLSLELLRRAGKEYDRYILVQYTRTKAGLGTEPSPSSTDAVNKNAANATTRSVSTQTSFRPNVLQQAIRALLHMLQFAVAYFVMLLAMYYNGYIIICIFIGAFLGYFIFGWESFNVSQGGRDRLQEEVTRLQNGLLSHGADASSMKYMQAFYILRLDERFLG
ncbi:Copper Transporter integral membrane protein that functions in high affinity copper transport [Kalmusia sp. IMI 367209]|nr:Copper Transporter integral membrane protein that functions in high affinity copper transport [Kalmusia sp. IMI 367209]